MPTYSVEVGNIGTVAETSNFMKACARYAEYVRLSKAGYGRAGHEAVTLFKNGEIFKEWDCRAATDASTQTFIERTLSCGHGIKVTHIRRVHWCPVCKRRRRPSAPMDAVTDDEQL